MQQRSSEEQKRCPGQPQRSPGGSSHGAGVRRSQPRRGAGHGVWRSCRGARTIPQLPAQPRCLCLRASPLPFISTGAAAAAPLPQRLPSVSSSWRPGRLQREAGGGKEPATCFDFFPPPRHPLIYWQSGKAEKSSLRPKHCLSPVLWLQCSGTSTPGNLFPLLHLLPAIFLGVALSLVKSIRSPETHAPSPFSSLRLEALQSPPIALRNSPHQSLLTVSSSSEPSREFLPPPPTCDLPPLWMM